MDLVPGTVIADRFRLERELGRGGMGSVWLAHHVGLDVLCAVKFIEGEAAESDEAKHRFEREAKAAAHLRSSNVVQILDHGVFEGRPYIAMEYLEGEDLGKRLERFGLLQAQETYAIMTQVARALVKAHAAGIVHRDLKPENIYLVREDDREVAKVLDFGIAKHTSNQITDSGTKTGALLGTPYYMSPEQARGVRQIDHRSDLWSMGVIIFECMTGDLPFKSQALGDLLVKIMFADLPMPSAIVPSLPKELDQWWKRAAAREPNERFASAKELVEAFGAVFGLVDAPSGARAPMPSAEISSPGDGSPARTGELGLATRREQRTPSPTSATYNGPAPRAPERRLVAWVTAGVGALVVLGGLTAVLTLRKSEDVAPVPAAQPVAEPRPAEATPAPTAKAEAPATPAAPAAPAAPAPPAEIDRAEPKAAASKAVAKAPASPRAPKETKDTKHTAAAPPAPPAKAPAAKPKGGGGFDFGI